MDDLESRIDDQESKINDLESRLEDLESYGVAPNVPVNTREQNTSAPVFPQSGAVVQKQFVFALIRKEIVTSIKISGPGDEEKESAVVDCVTNIVEYPVFNENIRHSVKDKARKAACLLNTFGCEIIKIEVLAFNSYAEASEARDKTSFSEEVTIYSF
jgi:hypothetical protein